MNLNTFKKLNCYMVLARNVRGRRKRRLHRPEPTLTDAVWSTIVYPRTWVVDISQAAIKLLLITFTICTMKEEQGCFS